MRRNRKKTIKHYQTKTIRRSFREFRIYWKAYLFQSAMASLVLLLILYFLSLEHVIIAASLGASIFIAFATPHSPFAHPRHILGGHLIGFLCGYILVVPTLLFPETTLVMYALSVGCSIFFMVALDAEHPPAAGTALWAVTQRASIQTGVILIVSLLLISAIHYRFKDRFKDIT